MDYIKFVDASPEFKRLWGRVERRIDKLEQLAPLTGDGSPIETVEHNWRGTMELWRKLISSEQGKREVVGVVKKAFGEAKKNRGDLLLHKAIATGHGTLVEEILRIHDELDPDKAWARQESTFYVRAIEIRWPTVAVLEAIARRTPEDVPAALNWLLDDIDEYVNNNPKRTLMYTEAVNAWMAVGERSADIVAPAISQWAITHPDVRVGPEQLEAALQRLVSFGQARTLAEVAQDSRTRPDAGQDRRPLRM